MIPRSVPDLGWSDLGFAALSYLSTDRRDLLQAAIEAEWSSPDRSLVCFSVRSGLDLVLQTLNLPLGSEVLVSAITIPDMVRILEQHGLVPVPIDLEMSTLSVSVDRLAQACSERTQAILVAHLFGSRMPLDEIAEFAQQHGLYLLEDCAQAYSGEAYTGHPGSDVSLFSFGPSKTATALGGALLQFRDPKLREQVRSLQNRYPLQSRWLFLRRIGLFALFKLLTWPFIFQGFVIGCRWLGTSHDRLIRANMRPFKGNDLFSYLRQQPCTPLLRLLQRRLRSSPLQTIQQRITFAQKVLAQLPDVSFPGQQAQFHTHWVLPMQTRSPDQLVQLLWQHGFDASRGTSSVCVLDSPSNPTARPTEALRVMAQLVYLPMVPALGDRDLQRLAQLIREFAAQQPQNPIKKGEAFSLPPDGF